MSDDARALLAALKGEPPEKPAGDRAALEERADSGDEAARGELRARAFIEDLPGRVRAAVDADRARVLLADGSSLALDEAERLLARKEERAAHGPLRDAVDDALASFRRLTNHRIEITTDRANLLAFVSDTRDLRDAALPALASLGGEAPLHPHALARALDLPDVGGAFGDAAPAGLLHAAREAAEPARRVARFRAPRLLAGTVVDDADTVRFAYPALLRFDRHARTVAAGAEALACGAGRTRLSGAAMALGLLATPVRRALGMGRADAERVGRIAAATAILHVRMRACLAVADGDPRDALAEALGGDPGPVHAAAWTLDDAGAALRAVQSAALACALRDAFDEVFPLTRDAWRAPLDEVPTHPSAAWAAWAGAAL